jgi:hypothetical protein
MVPGVWRPEAIEKDQPRSGGVGEDDAQRQQGTGRRPVADARPVVVVVVAHPLAPVS